MSQPTSPSRLHHFVRFLFLSLVRLFYPKMEVTGRQNLPADGPIIFVLNHPNGLVDPLVLMAGLNRTVSFWAKSTLFGNPVGKLLMDAFNAQPIFRQMDEGKRGGPQGDAKAHNEETFAQCRKMLQHGGAMALFPEGTTHSESHLLPMRTGAARIALSTEAEANGSAGVQIVPVGLWYQSKTHFRTSVLLVVGQPFTVTEYGNSYATTQNKTVHEVTHKIEHSLDKVVLQAENADLLAAVPVLAAWVAPHGQAQSLPEQRAWSGKLLAAYEQLKETDPDRLEQINRDARQYADTLHSLGVDNPWNLELPEANHRRLLRLVALLLLTLPFALVGLIMSYIPYRITGPIATTATKSFDTQTSTVKLIGGAILVLLAWILEALVVGGWFGWQWGALLFLAAPPLAYIALRWGEGWRELRTVASARWLRLQRGQLVESLAVQRQALAQEVLDAVETVTV